MRLLACVMIIGHPLMGQDTGTVMGRDLPIDVQRKAAVRAVAIVVQPKGVKFRIPMDRVCRFDLLDSECPPASAYGKLSDPLPQMPKHDSVTYSMVTQLYGTNERGAALLRFQRPLLRGDTISVEISIVEPLEEPDTFEETTFEVMLSNTSEPAVLSKRVSRLSLLHKGHML